jgi:hypothetical protein
VIHPRIRAPIGKALILFAALLLSGSAIARAAVSEPSWQDAKDQAHRWTGEMIENIARDGRYDVEDFKSHFRDVWATAKNIETTERTQHKKRLAAAPQERRLMERIFELRMLYIYGNLLPRILDESTSHAPGRAFMDSKLVLAIEEPDFRARHSALRRQSRLSDELLGFDPLNKPAQ